MEKWDKDTPLPSRAERKPATHANISDEKLKTHPAHIRKDSHVKQYWHVSEVETGIK